MLPIQQFGEWFFCICNVILGICAKIFKSCTRWMWTQKWEWCETSGWKSCGCTQTMVVAVVLFSSWRSNAFLSRKKMFEPCKLRCEALRIMWRSYQHELQDVSCVFYCFCQIVNWQWYACRRLLRMVGTIWCQRDSSSMLILKKRRQPCFPWQLQYVLLNYSVFYNL